MQVACCSYNNWLRTAWLRFHKANKFWFGLFINNINLTILILKKLRTSWQFVSPNNHCLGWISSPMVCQSCQKFHPHHGFCYWYSTCAKDWCSQVAPCCSSVSDPSSLGIFQLSSKIFLTVSSLIFVDILPHNNNLKRSPFYSSAQRVVGSSVPIPHDQDAHDQKTELLGTRKFSCKFFFLK